MENISFQTFDLLPERVRTFDISVFAAKLLRLPCMRATDTERGPRSSQDVIR